MKKLRFNLFSKPAKQEEIKQQHVFFVHIPKTAGTSFRTAARKYFGRQNTLFDYGKRPSTSRVIKELIYEQDDYYELNKYIQDREKIFLAGHINVVKYMDFFKTTHTITFVRDPIAQVISHYTYRQKKHGINISLKEFVQQEQFSNVQSRYLQHKPLELFGFIGLTEEYETSLSIINHYLGTDIKSMKINTTKNSQQLKESLDEETLALIQKHNQLDIELYERAKALFFLHKKAYDNKEPYLYQWVHETTPKQVRGVAYYRESDEAAAVEIKSKDGSTKKIIAQERRPGMLVHNLPRNGYVGYSYLL